MTDYWVSTKKHYCETCNCWISGYKVNIKNHEKSARHIDNLKKFINESLKRKEKEAKENEFIESELRKLDNVGKNYLSTLKKNEKLPQSYCFMNVNTYNSNNKDKEEWILMMHEDTGCLVFFNKANSQIIYEKPKNYDGKIPEYQKFSEQNGWFKYFDYNFNNFYYYNIYNYEIIWQYSLSTINNFIELINKYEAADKNNNFNSVTNNLKKMITPNSLSNQDVLQNNSYYASSVSHIIPYINNDINLLNLQDKANLDKNNLKSDQTERNIGENITHMVINANTDGNNSCSSSNNNLNKTSNLNNFNNDKKMNRVALSTFDRNKEKDINEIDDKKSQSDEAEIENGKLTNSKEINAINKEHKTNNKNSHETMSIYNIFDKEKKKKITINHAPRKNDINIFSSSYDKSTCIFEKKITIKYDNNKNKNEENEKCKKAKNDEGSMLGAWQEVEKQKINIISNESIEETFYNIKSNEEIEKQEFAQMEENIRNEYSACNEFYIKKKVLENDTLYLNQEFKFVNKPIYKKTIDKNLNKKVGFAKRNMKPTGNKKRTIN